MIAGYFLDTGGRVFQLAVAACKLLGGLLGRLGSWQLAAGRLLAAEQAVRWRQPWASIYGYRLFDSCQAAGMICGSSSGQLVQPSPAPVYLRLQCETWRPQVSNGPWA